MLQLGSSRAGIGNRRGRYDQVWIWFARGRRFAVRRDKPFRPHLGEAPQDRDRLRQTRRHRHPCSKARRCTVVSSFIREMRSFARQSDAGRIIAFRNRLIHAYAAVSNESSGALSRLIYQSCALRYGGPWRRHALENAPTDESRIASRQKASVLVVAAWEPSPRLSDDKRLSQLQNRTPHG